MANIRAMGDVLIVMTTLTEDIIEKVTRYYPEALKIKDEDDNEIFQVGMGPASVSKYGICFCSKNPDGTLFMTTDNVVTRDHTDAEEEKTLIKDKYAAVLNFLNIIEQNVDHCINDIVAIEAAVDGSIEVVPTAPRNTEPNPIPELQTDDF